MIPIYGIDHAAINVKDLDKSLAFYTGLLGFKITEREYSKPGIEYFLDCGDSLIGLIKDDGTEEPHLLKDGGIGGNHISFRIKTKDFDRTIEELKASNVKISFSKKREKTWSLYFYDPDGNKLEMTAWPEEDKSYLEENNG